MARYNRWQNHLVISALSTGGAAVCRRLIEGAEGQLGRLLSQGLSQDLTWLRRIDRAEGALHPALAEGLALADFDAWRRERQEADARLVAWALHADPQVGAGQLFWYRADIGRVISQPLDLCLTQMFFAQAEARARVQISLAGRAPALILPDLLALPEDADWM